MMDFDPCRDALFLDIDGTLLDLAAVPDGVVVPDSLIEDLTRLYRISNGALAFITGRKIENADELFTPLRLPCAGVHGAEWRSGPHEPVHKLEPLDPLLRQRLAEAFQEKKGILVEDKIFAVSVHYRRVPDMAQSVEAQVLEIILPYKNQVSVCHSRKTVEVMKNGFDKGQALERFLAEAPFKNRRPLFIGDSLTDLSAIKACERNGGIGAWVGREEASNPGFEKPEKVREWIGKIARRIGE